MPERIIFPEKGVVALQEFDPGRPASKQLRIRTLYSLMSIGTETTILHQRYAPDSHFARMFSFPQLKTGVQAVGIVEDRGAEAREFSAGDRVFMRMAHGSHQVLAESACSPVPDNIEPVSACWCGLAKTAFRAAWAGRFEQRGHVLIIGAGPVGQMAIRWAAAADIETIAVADVSATRLEHAKAGGATVTLHGEVSSDDSRLQALNAGAGPELIIDATGNPAVFATALASAARFGEVILLGDTGYPQRQCLTSDVMTKGLTIQATHDSHDKDGWDQRRIDERFFQYVAAQRFNLDGLIGAQFVPDDCASAYEMAETQRAETMGILFDWTGRAH